MIDWSKLKPYEGDKHKSFEELCYQIAKELYKHDGSFTSIDDSGGGDGVEFYITLPNGDQWGWQAKFYYPNKRLSESSRKNSIKGSLKKAYEEHPNLKKWFLCTPTNLTRTERYWFTRTLSNSIPENMDVELEHWGDSEFNRWLSEPRFSGKLNYFFGDLELSFDWFKRQVQKSTVSIQEKFSPALHTETEIDSIIHGFLGDQVFAQYFKEQLTNLENENNELNEAITELKNNKNSRIDWEGSISSLFPIAEEIKESFSEIIDILKEISDLLSEQRLDQIDLESLDAFYTKVQGELRIYLEIKSSIELTRIAYTGDEKDRDRILQEAEMIIGRPGGILGRLLDSLYVLIDKLRDLSKSDMHIFGDAGVGKTHIVSHICDERIKDELPALLVLGRHFTRNQPIREQLKQILDIPSTYSWSEFLRFLDVASQVYRTRIPLVIDGLNEATHNGSYSDVWRLGLQDFIHEISQTKGIVLITTCRTTYEKTIWSDNEPKNRVKALGFDIEDVETAIDKYFSHYKIKADLTAAPLYQFQHPIYLKIFCETQNPERKNEKEIFIGEYSLFKVFDEYLKICNIEICYRLGLLNRTYLVEPCLVKIAEYLWEHKTRNILLDDLVMIVDNQQRIDLPRGQSRTNAILDEGLLICRDLYELEEVVYFTYDLLGGYIIAKYLLQKEGDNVKEFIQSEDTIKVLFSEKYENLHPLSNDIGRCLAGLLPIQKEIYLHELLSKNRKAFSLSVRALFELPPDNVNDSCTDLISKLFGDSQNRIRLLELAENTNLHVQHPFNANFWSELLQELPISERDISWAEYVRNNRNQMAKILEYFETICRSDDNLTENTIQRLHLLAEYTMWFLTSTVRPLRDKATRALYWYGRRMPDKLFDLVLCSLKINDPYVSERMLAATYGVAMAKQFDFEDSNFTENILPIYGRKLYEAMFAPNAPFSTTHILARDYSRYTIEIALIHHPDLLSEEEKGRITPPFLDGGIREWGESEDKNKGEYRDGNSPIGMDFENYTIGKLVRDRENYDFSHNEFKKIKANIFWRMYDLGYDLNIFGGIDKNIARDNRHIVRYDDGKKTDRYGKKYSWIAFFELAGFRQKEDLDEDWYYESRISDADIDPSFPEEVQSCHYSEIYFLGDRALSLEDWIDNGETPDISSEFIIEEICGERGPWVLLDGYINQEDIEIKRNCFIFPRGFFVKEEDLNEIKTFLQNQEIGGGWLPSIPEDFYVYAGEIPWCGTFSFNGNTTIEFVLSTMKKKVPIPNILLSNDENASMEKEFEIEVPNEKKIFEIFIPVRDNNWESYHCSINHGRSVLVPAKEITEFLNLCSQPQTFDLYEKNGKKASITIRVGKSWDTSSHLIYLRQDLLDRYLKENNLTFIWGIWGERKFYTKDIREMSEFSQEQQAYKIFQYIKSYEEIK